MKRCFLLLTLCLLSLWRVVKEVLILLTLSQESQQWLSFVLAIIILLIVYVIPISMLVIWFFREKGQTWKEYCCALVFGALIMGQPAGFINNLFASKLLALFPDTLVLKEWISSIVPPIVEEGLKLGLAIVLVYLLRVKSIWIALAIGVGVGLGFQLSEDYTYVLSTPVDHQLTPIQEAFSRLSSSFAGHWLLTALMTGAWFLLIKMKVKNALVKWYLIGPILLHMIWNTSIVDQSIVLKIGLIMVSWLLLGNLYHLVLKMEKEEDRNL
ncbi:PrsW family glutamic-type intramembrane protease [Streptococcus pluranimalium]